MVYLIAPGRSTTRRGTPINPIHIPRKVIPLSSLCVSTAPSRSKAMRLTGTLQHEANIVRIGLVPPRNFHINFIARARFATGPGKEAQDNLGWKGLGLESFMRTVHGHGMHRETKRAVGVALVAILGPTNPYFTGRSIGKAQNQGIILPGFGKTPWVGTFSQDTHIGRDKVI